MIDDTRYIQFVNPKIWEIFCGTFGSSLTEASYLSDISEFCRITQQDFLDTTEKDVETYFNEMSDRVFAGRLCGRTVTKKFRELHSFYRFCMEHQFVRTQINVFDLYLRKFEGESEHASVITPDDMDRLLKAAQNDLTAYVLLTAMYRAGISSTELITLKSIHEFEVHEEGVFLLPGKRKEYCYVPDDVWQLLKEYDETVADIRRESAFFVNRRGRRLNMMFFSRMMHMYTAAAGIERYSSREVTAACYANLFAYGVRKKDIAKQKGRTQIQIGRYNIPGYAAKLKKAANEAVKIQITPPHERHHT